MVDPSRPPNAAPPAFGNLDDRTVTSPSTDTAVRSVLAPADRSGDLGRLGRYRVLRVLGRGGMGVVFEAEDDKLKRRVALKALLPDIGAAAVARERFVREARAAAAVEHDNIVPVHEVAEVNNVPFIAMPLLAGETLDERLNVSPPLTIPEVLAVGRQVADGLAAAHTAGLIHRDIKPGNVWLERTASGAFKRARVLDFGLAPSVADAGPTASGAVLGTPAYMAPEQARGQVVDPRADLFSLGCVLYEMATGQRPFRGADTLATLSALATDVPPAPNQVNPAVPAALSTLIELLLSKNPINRWPPTAQEVSDELFRIINDPLSSSGARPGLPAPPPPPRPTMRATVAPKPEEVWPGADSETEQEADVPTALPAEESEPERNTNPARRRREWVLAALAALTVGLALAAAVVYTETNKGELAVEVDDPTVEVKVVHGDTLVADSSTGRGWVLKPGAGKVTFYDPVTGAEAITEPFQIRRGERAVVRVSLADIAAKRSKQPERAPPGAPIPK